MVPLIIWSPNRIKRGVLDTEHMVNNVDIMPTVCDYAGIEPPPLHRGASLRPLVDVGKEEAGLWRKEIYSEWQVTGRIIRTRQYKWVVKYQYSGDFEKPFVWKSDGTHTQFFPGRGEEYAEYPNTLLFDLEKDPWELNNLASDPNYDPVAQEHRRILREWEARLVPGQHYDRN